MDPESSADILATNPTPSPPLPAGNGELRNQNPGLSTFHLKDIVSHVAPPVLIAGGDLRLRHFTSSAEALFDLSSTDIGRPVTELFSALGVSGLETLIPDAIQRKRIAEREVEDRRGRWYLLQVQPYKSSDNRWDGAVITLVDISKLKLEALEARAYAEQSLRSSEARLRALVSSMDDIVFEVDENGKCLSAWTGDPQFLAQAEVGQVFHRIEDFLPTRVPHPLQEAFQRVLKSKKPENVEYSLEVGGTKRWFQARINRIASQESVPKTLSVLVRDITARKEAEIALLQSEERFRLLVEGVKEYAIFALDTQGRVVSWNRGAERIKGYKPQEIIGKHFSVFYLPEDVAAGKPERDLQIAAAEGRFEDVAGWRLRKDGSKFYANLLISAIRDKDGTLRGFTKVTRDITDRMHAEAAVRQLSGHILRLQDNERRRIARELHDSTAQLLTAISMNLSLVRKSHAVARDAQAFNLVAESEVLANQASDELRNLSHLLHPPDLDAVGLVAAVRWYAARFEERSGVAVKLHMPANLCRLPQDNEIALFRVAQESLTNVQRHSGSKVVRIRIEQHGDVVDMEIEDKGHGIPPGVLDAEQQSVERLGIGIAGMRERLKQIGGRLAIVSTPRGTKVIATVPCPPQEPSQNDGAGPRA